MTVRTPPRVTRATRPWIDRTREEKWLAEHQREYRGQYVLLDGEQLVTSGADLKALMVEARAKGHPDPFVHFVPPDDTLFWSGIYE